jgi:CRISPR-associated protein Cmr4
LLEEFVFEAEESEELKKFVELVGTFVGEENKRRIVCVNDTDFMDFVSNYTEVQTHIKIDLDTGTVKRGHYGPKSMCLRSLFLPLALYS